MGQKVPGNEMIYRETLAAEVDRVSGCTLARSARVERCARPVGVSTCAPHGANQKKTSKSTLTSTLAHQTVCALDKSSGADTAWAGRTQRRTPERGAGVDVRDPGSEWFTQLSVEKHHFSGESDINAPPRASASRALVLVHLGRSAHLARRRASQADAQTSQSVRSKATQKARFGPLWQFIDFSNALTNSRLRSLLSTQTKQ